MELLSAERRAVIVLDVPHQHVEVDRQPASLALLC
jgi:hypothetical protein